jgi:hypothetical protein
MNQYQKMERLASGIIGMVCCRGGRIMRRKVMAAAKTAKATRGKTHRTTFRLIPLLSADVEAPSNNNEF